MLQLTPRFFAAPVAAFCAIGLLSFQGQRPAVQQDQRPAIQLQAECAAGDTAAACRSRN